MKEKMPLVDLSRTHTFKIFVTFQKKSQVSRSDFGFVDCSVRPALTKLLHIYLYYYYVRLIIYAFYLDCKFVKSFSRSKNFK